MGEWLPAKDWFARAQANFSDETLQRIEGQRGSLTVRESQMAVFVNEGQVADVFGPGTYKLTTQTLPVLTYLKNWDKLFQSPFKSDVYFFSTRQQIDQKWGTPQPITIRDKDFGAVRLRAFGNYAYRIADPKLFHTEISGTRDSYPVADLEGQLRGMVLQNISNAIAGSGLPFLDLAANQVMFAEALAKELAPHFAKIGLAIESLTVQNVSLPEELQKVLDQKIGMGMVGNDMGKFMQYQTAQAIPKFAEGAGNGGGGVIGVNYMPGDSIQRYGAIKIADTVKHPDGDAMRLAAFVEKPKPAEAPSQFGAIGRYVLPASIFAHLKQIKRGSGGEIQLTDAIATLAAVEPVYAVETVGRRYDCGTKLGYLEATVKLGLERPEFSAEFAAILKQLSL